MNVPNVLTMFRIVFASAVFYFCAVGNWDLCLLFFVLASLTDYVDGWWARKFNQITVFGRIMDPFADKFLICGVFICLLGIPALSHSRDVLLANLVLQPWMVVVIVARELLITSLRAVVERSGGDFSAKWIGKWKMGVQCIALISCFLFLAMGAEQQHQQSVLSKLATTDISANAEIKRNVQELSYIYHFDNFHISAEPVSVLGKYLPDSWQTPIFYTWLISLWATVLITLYSGLSYCFNAAKMIGTGNKE